MFSSSRLFLISASFLLNACNNNGLQSALNPAGEQAGHLYNLWWIFFGLCAFVYVAVMAFLLIALVKNRQKQSVGNTEPPDAHPETAAEERKGNIVKGLVAATVVIMFALMITSFRAGHALVSMSAVPQPITIKITGHQWWWEVEYTDDANPSKNITTANEIHVPAGQTVKLVMKSNDVIHSFWVPNLNGKKDLVPGFTTTMWLNAEKPETYLGQCAEFCGYQHAHMRFSVVADAPEDFKNWVSAQQKSSVQPATDLQKRGQEIFLTSSCVTCHTIQGTIANGRVGPSLTHVGSSSRLAAETIPNTPQHLGSWITDPQSIKPGVIMPMNAYSPEDLRALVEYIKSLK